MKSKVIGVLKPALTLFVIAAVMALFLGGTNLLTADTIRQREAQTQQQAIEKVLPADSYEAAETTLSGVAYSYYKAVKNSQTAGYAFILSCNGYGGAVQTVVGIGTDGKITGVEVSDVSGETPGLGQNAKNDSFTKQFLAKDSNLTVVKSGAGEDQVNAVTGATITSNAVTKNINTAFLLFQTVTGGAEHE